MSVLKPTVEILQNLAVVGQGRTTQSLAKTAMLTFLAGAYIALGGMLAFKVSGNLPAEWGSLIKLFMGGVFPVGLMMVLLAGADLFTGNCMFMCHAVLNRTASLTGLVKCWIFSWCGNLVGSVFVAFFIGYCTGALMDARPDGSLPIAATVVNLANAKCSLAFDVAFWRGFACNWLVCIAIFMASGASDGVSKVALFWPPITCFVTLGMEHSVANMFFIPLGIFIGEGQAYLTAAAAHPETMPALTATWKSFFITNLVPVTLGNIVGGAVMTSIIYQIAFGKSKAAAK